jgi:hypothetical protein
MNILDDKYRLPNNLLDLEVIEILDFQDYPILSLEMDKLGQKYLSYLIDDNNEEEIRATILVSDNRLKQFLSGEVELDILFKNSESGNAFIFFYSLASGELKSCFIIPIEEFLERYEIESGYKLKYNNPVQIEDSINHISKILQAKQKNKILIDFYINSQDLVNNVKLWAIRKILEPSIEIIKSIINIDPRYIEQKIALSNLKAGSLGFTIELSYEWNLFDEIPELDKVEKVIELFTAESKEEFIKVLESTNNEKFIGEYSKIINAIIDKNAFFSSALINPKKEYIPEATINKEKAAIIKKVIGETFPNITDVEEISGIFLEIDLVTKIPTFTIESTTDDALFHGKILPTLLDKLKADKINIGTDQYVFTIRTIYTPATPFKVEKLRSYLIDYKSET